MRVLVRVLAEVPPSGECKLHIQVGHEVQSTDLVMDQYLDFVFEEQEPPVVRGVSPKLRKRATTEERNIAEDLGGKRQVGSGAVPGIKGDVRVRGELRIESKITTKGSYRVELELLNKIRSECHGTERPAFIVSFVDKDTHREIDRWVLQPYEDWHSLVEHKRSTSGSDPSD